jgi:hypothetical protein
MKVSVRSHNSPPSGHGGRSRRTTEFLIVLLIVSLTSVATYVVTTRYLDADRLQAWASSRGHGSLRDDIPIWKAIPKIPERLLQTVEVPKLVIDIKFRHMEKIRKKRDEALARKLLVQGPDDFVPASIRHDNKTTKVKLRLKGDFIDHLRGRKWSFRIHVKGKDHLFGMRRFSIQHPKVRGYQGEALFFETLRHVGVLAPRYFFVDVSVNGRHVGLMALEEHFSKELLEANGRRESVIIRFDESLVWAATDDVKQGRNPVFDDYRNAPIDAFRSSRIAKSAKLSSDNAIAVGLLRGFVNGELTASEVFDAELLGRFLAVAELWASHHTIAWRNQRFYLNPITLKLEPIGYDATIQNRTSGNNTVSQAEPIVAAMLKDHEVFAAYQKTLRALTQEVVDGSLLTKLKEIEQQHLQALYQEYYLVQTYPYKELIARASHLLAMSKDELKTPTDSTENYPVLLHAHIVNDDNGRYLELGSAVPHNVEIQSIRWVTKGGNPDIEFQPSSTLSYPLHLPATALQSLPEMQRIYYEPPVDSSRHALEVTANIKGRKQHQAVEAKPYFKPLKQSPVPVSTVDAQLSRHHFLRLDRQQHSLYVEPGHWPVEDWLVVPRGFSLTIPAGTTLQFASEAGLIAHGRLRFDGTEDAEVLLEGRPVEDNQGTWQGIAVLNAGEPSRWQHVTIRNTTGIDRAGWQLTAGVTFYQSPVVMDHCRFQGSRGEDALNIVQSGFELNNLQIVDTASDAFDADFADGVVKGGLFQGIGKAGGGDAVDISGSVVTVQGTRFQDISDKALSIGEQSRMTASRLTIERAGTGAASKDGSQLDITDSTIEEVQHAALMAYMKKPEFGSARIEARNLTFLGTMPRARAQKGSTITIDGQPVPSEDLDVAQLYKTIMRPGLRQ